MFWLTIIRLCSGITLLITLIVVLRDLFKYNLFLGLLSLFIQPIIYYHSVKNYSGRKIIIVPVLFLSTIFIIGISYYLYNYG